MILELTELAEKDDGSVIMQLEADEEAKQYLINIGLIEMLKKSIKEYELENTAA